MKKYYLHNGSQQDGPFDIEELKARGINKETPIWYEGLNAWTKAGVLPELNILFAIMPPPFVPFSNEPQFVPAQPQFNQDKKTIYPLPPIAKKKKNVVGIVLILIGVLGTIAIISIIGYNYYLSNQNSPTSSQSYQEKVMTVEEVERADPPRFLDASGTYNSNFWGDAMKVHGSINNTATVANFKDVVVEVVFYSSTKTELDRKSYTIYDFFPAHSQKQFELKIAIPQHCEKLGWNTVSATAY